MITHKAMNDLLKEIDFKSLLCVPVVKAKVGSGFSGRLQRMMCSEIIDILGPKPLADGLSAISSLIQDCNSALKELNPPALCSAEITWRMQDNDPFTSKGYFVIVLMTEPMEEKPDSKFKPVSLQ